MTTDFEKDNLTVYSNVGSTPLVTLDFPTPLQQRVINALKADPRTVDLRAQAPHYYALGAKLLDLFEEEDRPGITVHSLAPAAHLEEGEEGSLVATISFAPNETIEAPRPLDADISVDHDFYELTPLNWPKGPIAAE